MDRTDERRAWVALAAVDGAGEVIFGRLVAAFGGAAAALAASTRGSPAAARHRLRVAAEAPISEKLGHGIRAAAADPVAIERRLAELGLWTRTPFDDDYPERLRELDPPPAVLWGQGDLAAVTFQRSVAVVGTRRPTPQGRVIAARIATRLVECGAVVVSGLAFGIDGVAHAATLDAGGRTVAVIGGGHAEPGPRAHRQLLERILATGGAVVGELAPDAKATRGTFPRRNRIISVLTEATIVVEAPLRSGALITAHHGLEQGRTVLVVPGRPFEAPTAGCLTLLRETPARPLIGLDEMVVDLGYDRPPDADTHPSDRGSHGAGTALSADAALRLLGPAERAVAERLRRGPASADTLIADTGLAPAVASGAVTLLLLRGWAQTVGPAYLPAGPLLVERPVSEPAA